jgi:PBP1b-binding outer membrane lipoprotein LpoB
MILYLTRGDNMHNCTFHRLFVKFIIVLISISLIASCASNTKIAISKKFDKSKSQITVMNFMSAGLKSGYDSFISDKLAFALTGKGFAVVERQRVQNILSELQLEASGLLNKSDLSKVGKLSNVDIICSGTVYYQSSYRGYIFPYTMMVKFVDVTSGEVVFMAECTNEKDWDGSNCVREISEELSKAEK